MLLDALRPGRGDVAGPKTLGRPMPAYHGPERRMAAGDPWHWLRMALDEVDYGMLIVAEPSRVLHMNHLARTELDGPHPLHVAAGQLRAANPDDEGPLLDALSDATRRQRRCMLTVGGAPQRISIAVVPLPAPQPGEPGVTLLMFSKRRVCEELSVDAFARAHGLTVAETQVLKALCAGVTPNEAAQGQGVRLSTVRTQIGSIRAKTGATSIRALVQQVARLPPLLSALRSPGASNDEGMPPRMTA